MPITTYWYLLESPLLLPYFTLSLNFLPLSLLSSSLLPSLSSLLSLFFQSPVLALKFHPVDLIR